MFRLLLMYELLVFSGLFIVLTIKDVFERIERGEKTTPYVIIALNAVCAILSFRHISFLGFTFSIIGTELLSLGILDFLVSLYNREGNYFSPTFYIVIPIVLVIWFGGIKFTNNIFFDSMCYSVNKHYSKIDTGREARKLNTKTELEKVLVELKKNDFKVTKDNINRQISKFNYRRYNGIYCYEVEEREDCFYVGMTIGENNYIKQSPDMTKPFHYKVEKNTLEIFE